jgi:predicted ATPase
LLIRFSLATCRWEYDLHAISEEKIPSDIIKHVAERILRLSESFQLGLQVAACLGSAFEFETFRKVYSGSALELDDFLSTVTDGGFIQETCPGQYTWSHDQIQQAAYSLISSDKLRPMHLLIGIKLYRYTESNELHRVIHDIVKNTLKDPSNG